MYRKISDFITDYTAESKKTVAVIQAIPSNLLTSRIDPKGMTLAELVLHITQAIEKITSQIGFEYSPSTLVLDAPSDTEGLLDIYTLTAARVLEIVSSKTDDSFLGTTFPVYGSSWSAGQTLSVLVKHEIHHRGQLVIGLRLLGLDVPDVYGPTRSSKSKLPTS
jgi:uncharacterized damage-inducible protein DinB